MEKIPASKWTLAIEIYLIYLDLPMDLGHHLAILYLVLGCRVAGAQSTSALIVSAALGAGSPSGMIARVGYLKNDERRLDGLQNWFNYLMYISNNHQS